MNIVVIHASPRSGNTDDLIKRVKKHLSSEDSFDFTDVYLPREAPVFCHGCFSCFERGEETCPNVKYIQPIARQIANADGLIIATPIYVMQIPGALKAFLDHMAYLFLNHRPSLFGKKAFVITNTAGAGNANAIKYLKQILSFWGITNVTTLGITLQAASLDEMKSRRHQKSVKKIHQKTLFFLKQLKDQRSKKHPTLLSVIMFHISRALMRSMSHNNADRQYWEKMGWLDSSTLFYVDQKPLWYQTLAGKTAARIAFK